MVLGPGTVFVYFMFLRKIKAIYFCVQISIIQIEQIVDGVLRIGTRGHRRRQNHGSLSLNLQTPFARFEQGFAYLVCVYVCWYRY